MTEDAPKPRYVFAGQTFDEVPDELTLPLPREYGLGPQAPQHRALNLREPTEDEVTKFRGKDRAFCIAMISGVPEPVVRQLPVRIVNAAESYLLFFVEAGRSTDPSES